MTEKFPGPVIGVTATPQRSDRRLIHYLQQTGKGRRDYEYGDTGRTLVLDLPAHYHDGAGICYADDMNCCDESEEND